MQTTRNTDATTVALCAIQDEAQHKLPALGYTVPYAIGNIRSPPGDQSASL
jgi:hypothetical protein